MIRRCRLEGWRVTPRLSVGPNHTNKVRSAGVEYGLRAWLQERNFAFAGPVELFKDAGWLQVELTVIWDRRYDEPWILVSDQPAGRARVREYRRRTQIEATFEDTRLRGFDLERTKVVAHDRINRLLLALVLALWWGTQAGLRMIRSGRRRAYDRSDRRVLRLGRRDIAEHLDNQLCLALPFRRYHEAWHYARYA